MKKQTLEIKGVESSVVEAIKELADTQFEGHMNLALREIVEKGILLYGKMDEMDRRIGEMETFFYSKRDLIEQVVALATNKRKSKRRIDGSWR